MKRKMHVILAWLLFAVALSVCIYSLYLYRKRGVQIMRKSSAQMLGMLANEKRNESVNYINLLSDGITLLKEMTDRGDDIADVKSLALKLGFDSAELYDVAQDRNVDISVGRLSFSRATARGTLTCRLDRESTRLIFDSSDDEERFYSFLSDSEGNILTSVDHDDFLNVSDNTVQFYSEAILYDGVTPEDVLTALENSRGGYLTYSYGSRSSNVCYVPLGINDWTLFIAATSELTDEGKRDIDRRVMELGVAMGICILMLVAASTLKTKRLNDDLKKAQADCDLNREIADELKTLSFTILFECDLKTGVINYNDSFERQLGRKPGIANISTLLRDDADRRLRNMAQEMKRGVPKGKASVQLLHANGAPIWYQIYYECVYEKNETVPSRVVGRIANIEWHDHEQDAQTAVVEHDALTGLLGHTEFMKRAERLVKSTRGECAMLTIDIDDFKIVSQTETKYSGDELIVRMSDAMRRTLPAGALTGRISGDVFAAILTNELSNDYLAQKAVALESEFEKTGCTCSIGIAAADDTASLAELCARADKALYRAKLLGKHGYQFFDGAGESDLVKEDDTDDNALLFKCVTSISTIRDFDEAMKYVLKQTAKFYDADRATIFLSDDANARFVQRSIYAREKRYDADSFSFAYAVAPNIVETVKEHKPLTIFDNVTSMDLAQTEIDIIRQRGEKSVYLVPLGDDKSRVGFLGIANPKYHVGNVSFMRTLATCIGCDIEKRRDIK